jgi:hypothetical protein
MLSRAGYPPLNLPIWGEENSIVGLAYELLSIRYSFAFLAYLMINNPTLTIYKLTMSSLCQRLNG